MNKVINECECLHRMKLLGQISEYNKSHAEKFDYYNYNAFDGQICLVQEKVTSELSYDESGVHQEYRISNELIPINYCPYCGKKIEYTKDNHMKLERRIDR